jgi:hypothetical protein
MRRRLSGALVAWVRAISGMSERSLNVPMTLVPGIAVPSQRRCLAGETGFGR